MPEEASTRVISEGDVGTLKVRKSRIPKFLRNRYFIFSIATFLFFASLVILILVDESNTFRPKWADAAFDWLRRAGFTWNVTFATWFIFLIVFGLFFFIFFVTLFYKNGLEKKAEKIQWKYGREITYPEKRRYKFWFIFFSIFTLIAVIGTFTALLAVAGYMETVARQLSENFAEQLVNFILTLAMLVGLMSVVPVTFGLIYLIFKLLVSMIALMVGNVQSTIMRSDDYQQNYAAAQAVSEELKDRIASAKPKLGRGGGGGGSGGNGGGGGGSGSVESPHADIIFPALTSIDIKWEEKIRKQQERQAKIDAGEAVEDEPEETASDAEVEIMIGAGAARTTRGAKPTEARGPLDYEQFKLLAYEFQSYLCHNKYYFKINTLRYFIAGMAAARLLLLQGLSGTGKSTLPRVFLEYIGGDAYFFPVQATWRDRSDITGYYSDFTGQFKETELLKHLYEASYIPETCNLMVLDEMNISRVEYYFADFLSIFEYPAEDWVVPLIQVKPGTKLPKYIENGMVRIPVNTWFVGTVNIDDSTFTITDKVYDRAIAIDFNELNLPFESSYRFDPHPIKIQELIAVFNECKSKPENNLTPAERKKFLDLVKFISDTFDIQFGNRIMNQIDNFLPVFVGLGGTKNEALDFMVARKVLRKLDGKFESYIKDGLNKLNRYLNSTYGKRAFPESEAMIEKYRRKLS